MISSRRQSLKLASRQDLAVGETARIDKENWDFHGADTQYLLHSIHPYPARFIPQIPHRAMQRWTRHGDTVLDPFCGCGTTLLEARLLGRNSVGVDNNDVATLVARAKTAQYTEKDLESVEALCDRISAAWSEGFVDERFDHLLQTAPAYASRAKWFAERAVAELSFLRSGIFRLREPARLLALAVFSAVVVRASRQDSDTRYAAVNRNYAKGYAIDMWLDKTKDAVERARFVSSTPRGTTHRIIGGDSRRLDSLADETIKLVVTSPPYLNAYDYHKYHRHRLHWIGGDVSLARDLEIGKHDTFTRKGATPEPYFDDMRQCMAEWFRVLTPGGRALMVVGDAVVNKRFVPIGDLLLQSASEIGFSVEKRWVRSLDLGRKSFNQKARIKREHVLLLKKER